MSEAEIEPIVAFAPPPMIRGGSLVLCAWGAPAAPGSAELAEAAAGSRVAIERALGSESIVAVSNGCPAERRHIRRLFRRQPDFEVASLTYRLADLMARATFPS